MQQLQETGSKLTFLQETILMELSMTTNLKFIEKKLNLKPISLTKSIQSLISKGLIEDKHLTEEGKRMVHYLKFRNDTIALFLSKSDINNTPDKRKQFANFDYQMIIALKNLLT